MDEDEATTTSVRVAIGHVFVRLNVLLHDYEAIKG